MKKRIIAGIVGLCTILSLVGCGSGEIKNDNITITQYKGFEVEKTQVVKVTDEEVEESIKMTRGIYGIKDRAVAEGDTIYFDYVGKKGLMWNDLAFMHKVTDAGTFQGGFILSHLNPAGKDAKPKDQGVSDYRVTGSASKKGNTYAVYKMNKDPMMMPERDFQFLLKLI